MAGNRSQVKNSKLIRSTGNPQTRPTGRGRNVVPEGILAQILGSDDGAEDVAQLPQPPQKGNIINRMMEAGDQAVAGGNIPFIAKPINEQINSLIGLTPEVAGGAQDNVVSFIKQMLGLGGNDEIASAGGLVQGLTEPAVVEKAKQPGALPRSRPADLKGPKVKKKRKVRRKAKHKVAAPRSTDTFVQDFLDGKTGVSEN